MGEGSRTVTCDINVATQSNSTSTQREIRIRGIEEINIPKRRSVSEIIDRTWSRSPSKIQCVICGWRGTQIPVRTCGPIVISPSTGPGEQIGPDKIGAGKRDDRNKTQTCRKFTKPEIFKRGDGLEVQ